MLIRQKLLIMITGILFLAVIPTKAQAYTCIDVEELDGTVRTVCPEDGPEYKELQAMLNPGPDQVDKEITGSIGNNSIGSTAGSASESRCGEGKASLVPNFVCTLVNAMRRNN